VDWQGLIDRIKARWLLAAWCVFGVVVLGVKASLDQTAAKYPDIAVRAGDAVYLIPRDMVDNDSLRIDLMRLAGCWDARESGLLPVAKPLADCGETQSMRLAFAAKDLGPDAEIGLRGKPLPLIFWPDYAPPGDHLPQLVDAWAGRGEWVGRKVILRADWQLFRVETPKSPWVHLLSHEPMKGDEAELERTYAGRCYRPEAASDAGITCTFVLRIGAKAAIEFSLGPDEMLSFVPIRDGLMAKTASWHKPLLADAH